MFFRIFDFFYLANECDSTIFLQPTSKEKTGNIISSLNSNKTSCPRSILIEYNFSLKTKFQSN